MLEKIKRLVKYPQTSIVLVFFLFMPSIIKRFFIDVKLDPNSYYYTLSTTVQGLSSLVGIIFVIIIFHFQNIHNQKKELINLIKDQTKGQGRTGYKEDLDLIDDLNLLNYCRELKGKIEDLQRPPDLITLNNYTVLLEKNLENKKLIIDNLLLPSILSFSAIIVGILGLGFKSLISVELLWESMLINLSLTILSLVEIIRFIRKTLLSK